MIYVDEPKEYVTRLRYKVWSHLWSDTAGVVDGVFHDDELHAMAVKLGLSRSWYQCKVGPRANEIGKIRASHYDVTPAKRLKAIKLGAIPMELGDYIRARLDQEVLPLVTTPTETATQASLLEMNR